MLHSSALIGLVGVADLGRARDFYGGVLEFDLVDESPHALVVELGGSMLRITAVRTPVIAPYTVLGWRVPDIDATVDHLVARGVVFSRYEGLE